MPVRQWLTSEDILDIAIHGNYGTSTQVIAGAGGALAGTARVLVGRRPMKKTKSSRKQTPPSSEVVDKVRSPEPSTLGGNTFARPSRRAARGTGADSAGQAGDLQDLSRHESTDSESVEELVAEGQYREAEIISAVEEADDPDQRELHPREVLQDDVPEEYRDED